MKQLQFLRYGTLQLIAYLISSVVGIVLAWKEYGLYAIVCMTILNSFLLLLLSYFFSRFLPVISIKKAELKAMVSYGGWLTLTEISRNIAQQMDKLFLSKWLSITALGAYNRPRGFIDSIAAKINDIFDVILFPILSNVQDNNTVIQTAFTKSLFLINLFSTILSLLMFFNAELIIQIFFGKEWLDITSIFRIISVIIIFRSNGRLTDCFFRSLAYVKQAFCFRLLSCFLTLIALFVGVYWDITGVAITLLLGEVLMILLKLYYLSVKIQIATKCIIKAFYESWLALLPVFILGILYLFVPIEHTLIIQVSFALGELILLLLLLLYFPHFIGSIYEEEIFPRIKTIINKCLNKWM